MKALALLTVAAATVLSLSTAACVVQETEDEADISGADVPGEGEGGDALVTERQLFGNELPTGTLSLTFDDGPGDRTKELVEYLAGEGIEATFFINGNRVPGRQQHVQAVVENGHLLANHTQRHEQLTKLSDADIVKEVSETDRIIVNAQPDRPFILRAPFGAWNAKTARAVNATPMSKYIGSVFWDIGGELTDRTAADWDCWNTDRATGKPKKTVEECGDLYIQEAVARRRGIVLSHDKHNKTVDLIKYIVPRLKQQGFKFAKLEDVPSVKRALEAGPAVVNNPDNCYSSTLGRSIEENVCVTSGRDGKKYRCTDGEWVLATGSCASTAN